ncbi:3-keto-disaccharide hydrolase [Pirellulaceae bacterium SH467]
MRMRKGAGWSDFSDDAVRVVPSPTRAQDAATFNHTPPLFLSTLSLTQAIFMIPSQPQPRSLFRSWTSSVPLLTAMFLAITSAASPLFGQLSTGWKQHDWDRERPAIVTPGELAGPVAHPSDAIVLFDGTSLDKWRSADGGPAKWVIKDGVMESVPGSGYVYTADSFGDVQLHVEWASPVKVVGKSQGRGNSGVFLQGLFEVQVLDSFDNITYADGQAGAIYGQYPPLVNASRKPGEWQTYDIVFRRPHYEPNGALQQPARMTVFHNGVLIQDNVRPLGPTSWLQHHPYSKSEEKRPLSFQDHGNPVRYRNVWLRELPPETIPQPKSAYDPVIVELTEDQKKRLVGSYQRSGGGSWQITSKNGKLYLNIIVNPLELIPHSASEFGLKYTAGLVTIQYDDAGNPKELKFQMGGETSRAVRAP